MTASFSHGARFAEPTVRTLPAAQKGPDARRRPAVRVERRPSADARRGLSGSAGEAYSLYVEPAVEGSNEADGPFSAACLEVLAVADLFDHLPDAAVGVDLLQDIVRGHEAGVLPLPGRVHLLLEGAAGDLGDLGAAHPAHGG